jgi:hypothetical protein
MQAASVSTGPPQMPTAPEAAVERTPAGPESTPTTGRAPAPTPSSGVSVNAADAPRDRDYDFRAAVGGDVEKQLAKRLDDERVDSSWALETAESFNLVVARLPERSLIGDYAFTCKESLCQLEIKADAESIASADPKRNIQPALFRALNDPIAKELFDDSATFVGVDPATGLATLTIYAHRRKPVK